MQGAKVWFDHRCADRADGALVRASPLGRRPCRVATGRRPDQLAARGSSRPVVLLPALRLDVTSHRRRDAGRRRRRRPLRADRRARSTTPGRRSRATSRRCHQSRSTPATRHQPAGPDERHRAVLPVMRAQRLGACHLDLVRGRAGGLRVLVGRTPPRSSAWKAMRWAHSHRGGRTPFGDPHRRSRTPRLLPHLALASPASRSCGPTSRSTTHAERSARAPAGLHGGPRRPSSRAIRTSWRAALLTIAAMDPPPTAVHRRQRPWRSSTAKLPTTPPPSRLAAGVVDLTSTPTP